MKAFILLVAALAGVAEASHFRYGTMRWMLTEKQPDPTKALVKVSVELAFRLKWATDKIAASVGPAPWGSIYVGNSIAPFNGNYNNPDYDILQFGDGSQTTINDLVITQISEKDDTFMGIFEVYHNYPLTGTYNAVYTNCCRLRSDATPRGLNNNGNGHWHLLTEIQPTAPGGKSAVSSYLPIVEIGNHGKHHIDMVAIAPNKDDLVWSLASPTRMGGPGNADEGRQPSTDTSKYYIKSKTGQINWYVDGFATGLYCTQVLVSGSTTPDVKIPIDFFILVTPEVDLCAGECGNAGTICDPDAVTEAQSSCYGYCFDIHYGGDPCVGNAHPFVDVPKSVTQYLNTVVEFNVLFEPNPEAEKYQQLTMTTGTMPPGTIWEWNPAPYDQGRGHITLPVEMTAEPNSYAMCFQADDGYIHGPPACVRVEIIRYPVPAVTGPTYVHGYVDEVTEFSVRFDDDYGGDYHHLLWVVSELPNDCIVFETEDHDGHGHKAHLYISEECSHQTYDFEVCFAADDTHKGVHEIGPEMCVHVLVEERPNVGCFENYKTLAECNTEPLCYWDSDGVSDDHDAGEPGCYDFHHCYTMDGEKASCMGHYLCHYGHFGQCVPTHHEAMPFHNINNLDGDQCRRFSKKECRGVDDLKKDDMSLHCEWEPINQWCVTVELHKPHEDMCRRIDNKAECKRAVRNGYRCNWRRDEGPSHGPNSSPGKCIGMLNPVNDNADPTDTLVTNHPEKATFSNKVFTHHDFTGDDREPGLFEHKEHHFRTDKDKYFLTDVEHGDDDAAAGLPR